MPEERDQEDFDKLDVVKKYFSREFNILSGEIRERLRSIRLPEGEKQELLKELAFLTKKRQREIVDYLEQFYDKITKKEA